MYLGHAQAFWFYKSQYVHWMCTNMIFLVSNILCVSIGGEWVGSISNSDNTYFNVVAAQSNSLSYYICSAVSRDSLHGIHSSALFLIPQSFSSTSLANVGYGEIIAKMKASPATSCRVKVNYIRSLRSVGQEH